MKRLMNLDFGSCKCIAGRWDSNHCE